MDDSQDKHRDDMILGQDIFSKLKIDFCFSDNTIRLNGGADEECTSPMKDVLNIKYIVSSDCFNN